MYAVYDQLTSTVVSRGFSDKPSAKQVRQKLNSDYYDNEQLTSIRLTGGSTRYIISRDVDHYFGESTPTNLFVASKKKKEKEDKSNEAVEVTAEDGEKVKKPKKAKGIKQKREDRYTDKR